MLRDIGSDCVDIIELHAAPSVWWVHVKALNGVELLLPGGAGVPRGGMWYVVLLLVFCQFISNHCVCRNPTTLQFGNTHEYTVR